MTTTAPATPAATQATVLRRVCAWCGRDLGSKPGDGVSGQSDGICPTCADKFLSDAGLLPAEEDGHVDATTQPEMTGVTRSDRIGAVRSGATRLPAARAHGPSVRLGG